MSMALSQKKIYFLENPVANLFVQGRKVFEKNIKQYKNFVDEQMFGKVINRKQSLKREL